MWSGMVEFNHMYHDLSPDYVKFYNEFCARLLAKYRFIDATSIDIDTILSNVWLCSICDYIDIRFDTDHVVISNPRSRATSVPVTYSKMDIVCNDIITVIDNILNDNLGYQILTYIIDRLVCRLPTIKINMRFNGDIPLIDCYVSFLRTTSITVLPDMIGILDHPHHSKNPFLPNNGWHFISLNDSECFDKILMTATHALCE